MVFLKHFRNIFQRNFENTAHKFLKYFGGNFVKFSEKLGSSFEEVAKKI